MTDIIGRMRVWMDLAAIGPAEGWQGRVADDVVVRLPYAPPGVPAEMRGLDQALQVLGAHWPGKRSFEWHDVVIRRTEDPELLVTTARSEAVMVSGQLYANDYIMMTRIRDGLVVEHIEYFNPLPVVALLAE